MNDDIRIDYENDGVYPPEGFTGLWEVYWPNRKLKFRGHYIDGEDHGRQSCWWENGRLAQTGICEHGQCKGVWLDYWDSGVKFKETEYVDSNNFIVRWYDSDGTVEKVQRFVNGVELDE